MSIHKRHQQISPTRWLNTLVVVTLMTVTVALAYLGYYYVGASTARHVTWFAPELFCHPLEERCFTALGRFGEMTARWHHDGRQLNVDVTMNGLVSHRAQAQLEALSSGHQPMHTTLTQIAPGHYRGAFDISSCETLSMTPRASLIMDTDKGLLGSWFDLPLRCD